MATDQPNAEYVSNKSATVEWLLLILSQMINDCHSIHSSYNWEAYIVCFALLPITRQRKIKDSVTVNCSCNKYNL